MPIIIGTPVTNATISAVCFIAFNLLLTITPSPQIICSGGKVLTGNHIEAHCFHSLTIVVTSGNTQPAHALLQCASIWYGQGDSNPRPID